METTINQDIWQEVSQLLDLQEQSGLPAMHLQEIESEAENVLELLAVLRAATYRTDAVSVEETVAELTIALEHLQHHIQELLPSLQKLFHLEP